MEEHTHYRELQDGGASVWIANGASVMLKVVSELGDPVEMNAEETRELGTLLLQLADRLDGEA